MAKRPKNIDLSIKKWIFGSGKGSVFIPKDFSDLGHCDAVFKTLSRMVQEGRLRRLSRGLYSYPKTHPVLGELFPPIGKILDAFSKLDGAKLQPAGAYAANILGLSDQVPARMVFLTGGQSRTVAVGSMTMILRHTVPRNTATAGRLSGLIIQALRFLGKDHIHEKQIRHLKSQLPPDERVLLLKDVKFAPVWMHRIFRELADVHENDRK